MNLDIGELVTAIGVSVSDAQKMIENHSVTNYLSYFEAEAKGKKNSPSGSRGLKARAVDFVLPSPQDIDDTRQISLPLVTMGHHNHLSLEKVKVKISFKAFIDAENRVVADLNVAGKRESLSADEAESAAPCLPEHDTIELVFERNDTSEGIARLNQELVKII